MNDKNYNVNQLIFSSTNAAVHSILKGEQPNLVAIVQVIDVNQATKVKQAITHCT